MPMLSLAAWEGTTKQQDEGLLTQRSRLLLTTLEPFLTLESIRKIRGDGGV